MKTPFFKREDFANIAISTGLLEIWDAQIMADLANQKVESLLEQIIELEEENRNLRDAISESYGDPFDWN